MSEALPVGDVPWGTVLLAFTVVAVTLAVLWCSRSSSAGSGDGGAGEDYAQRGFVAQRDLLNPKVRANHLDFNKHLHDRFAGQKIVPVRGEEGCYIGFTYGVCKDAMNDHSTFSSNPFPDDRLVALNTMSKADHTRVLRYVHNHYRQEDVDSIEECIQGIIDRCTDDLAANNGEGGDVVKWAKRIHMAITLARLGADHWVPKNDGNGSPKSWTRVDEVIALNDAVVALVAPLGGIGKRYEELPPFQWLRVVAGLARSVPSTLKMAARLGPRCAWSIIRPDVTVLFPPKRPRMGLRWHPELLPLVPQYFMSLYELLEASPADAEGPLPGIRKGVETGDLQLAEALTLMVQLMVNMTSANALCSMVYRLGTEAKAAATLAASPEEYSMAFVQEALRLDAPLMRNPRRLVKDPGTKWKDTPLKAGDQVLLFLGAANTDPAVFEGPMEFRLDRSYEKNPPLTFGSGMHYCLGSNLVKTEMKMALESLVKRFSSVKVLPGFERIDDIDVGNYGYRRLRVQVQVREA